MLILFYTFDWTHSSLGLIHVYITAVWVGKGPWHIRQQNSYGHKQKMEIIDKTWKQQRCKIEQPEIIFPYKIQKQESLEPFKKLVASVSATPLQDSLSFSITLFLILLFLLSLSKNLCLGCFSIHMSLSKPWKGKSYLPLLSGFYKYIYSMFYFGRWVMKNYLIWVWY